MKTNIGTKLIGQHAQIAVTTGAVGNTLFIEARGDGFKAAINCSLLSSFLKVIRNSMPSQDIRLTVSISQFVTRVTMFSDHSIKTVNASGAF